VNVKIALTRSRPSHRSSPNAVTFTANGAGFLHAGLTGALLDIVCGFSAGNVLASLFSVNCLAPAVGEVFIARGRVVKAGKKQVFARAELFAQTGDQLKRVATGDAILLPTSH